MLRHLKNTNELILYASISCGAAFIGRLYPAFFFPILLLRIGVFGYCVYVIASLEKNREMAIILGSSLFLGLVGGYWDLIEVWLRFDAERITTALSITAIFSALGIGLYLQIRSMRDGKPSKR